jgi:hypothetical protein
MKNTPRTLGVNRVFDAMTSQTWPTRTREGLKLKGSWGW